MSDSTIDGLPKARGMLAERFPLAPLTRFKTGGEAEVFFAPADIDDLSRFLKKAPKDMNVHALGFGSNILIRDGGLSGITVQLKSERFSAIEHDPDGKKLKCGAFASNMAIAKLALEKSIAGMEFLFGIPGSIGGSAITNAGCCGAELKDILVSIETVNAQTGEKGVMSAAECGFGYRSSLIPAGLIITSATLAGTEGNAAEIEKKMNAIRDKKDKSQPTYTKTAGSVFKNPEGRLAWQLIRDAGCQGMRIGGAAISPVHANFIVNESDATSADIEDLADKVRGAVYEKFGITLEYEMKIVGSRKAEGPEIA
ncbi:MAG: UDP-N-acetylmuramate dehydrogenase [Rickettsiales bacterium]|jgi:UDP-N-acetylmuramate dehydrogenase|nr:UDP-N-acetylmuramate dehydrogenase [Rickettsiales bacterium]